MAAKMRRVVVSSGAASSCDLEVWLFSGQEPGERSYQPRWVPKAEITDLAVAESACAGGALRKAIAQAALSLGWKQAVEDYLGVPVKGFRGRRPGSPSRRRQPVIEGAKRLEIARAVHRALGEPQIYEKLEHCVLETAGRDVGKRHNAQTLNDFKIVDTCYREYRNMLQSEGAFRDWNRWLKGYTAHAIAQARSRKSAITRAEALIFYRTRLLRQIKRLAG